MKLTFLHISNSCYLDLYKKIKKACPPLSLHGQLLWREFFYCVATKNSNFDRMENNPICVQIPWQKNPDALVKWAMVQLIKLSDSQLAYLFICRDLLVFRGLMP